MAKDLAIVLNDGSINSAVTSAIAAQKHRPVMIYIEISPPLPTHQRLAYEQQVAHFKPYREHTVSLESLPALSQASTNVDPRAVALSPHLIEMMPLMAVATRFAVQYEATAIYIGARVGPHENELARATEYFQIWSEMLQLPCEQHDLELLTPLLELDPWQVVDVAANVGAPLEKTWSCHQDGPSHCWACRGCYARDAAFQQSAKPDPLRVSNSSAAKK